MIKLSTKEIEHLIKGKCLKTVPEAYDMSKSISVSVFCLTYNQEKYIKDALDSFLMQRVDFNVEIIIHDDASTDSTQEILKQYAKKYPNVVKVFFEKENVYSKVGDTIEIERMHIKNASGKYVASCEGDDYWTDPFKLFIQKNLLDRYKKLNFCTHKVLKHDLLNSSNDCYIPERKTKSGVYNDYEFAKLVNIGYPFQTSSYFMRKSVYESFLDEYPLFAHILPTSDESVMYYFSNNGGVVYVDRTMSCWRQFTENSWNTNLLHSTSKEQNQRRRRLSRGIMEFYKYSGERFPSCIERSNRFMIVTHLSENNIDMIFANKSMRKTFRNENFSRYLKLRIRSFIKKRK